MILAALLAAALATSPATAPKAVTVTDGFFVTREGAPLYLFEGDTMVGMSHCFGACARDYPPLLAPADATAVGEWTLIPRGGGDRQWAYRDKPVYTSAKPGAEIAKAEADGGMWRRAAPGTTRPMAAMTAPMHMPSGEEGSAFECKGGHAILARFASLDQTSTATVDAGDGPHVLKLAPWRGGEPSVTWTDGRRTLVWTTGVHLTWSDGGAPVACGRAEHHH